MRTGWTGRKKIPENTCVTFWNFFFKYYESPSYCSHSWTHPLLPPSPWVFEISEKGKAQFYSIKREWLFKKTVVSNVIFLGMFCPLILFMWVFFLFPRIDLVGLSLIYRYVNSASEWFLRYCRPALWGKYLISTSYSMWYR